MKNTDHHIGKEEVTVGNFTLIEIVLNFDLHNSQVY